MPGSTLDCPSDVNRLNLMGTYGFVANPGANNYAANAGNVATSFSTNAFKVCNPTATHPGGARERTRYNNGYRNPSATLGR
jgi:hypothetical protein